MVVVDVAKVDEEVGVSDVFSIVVGTTFVVADVVTDVSVLFVVLGVVTVDPGTVAIDGVGVAACVDPVTVAMDGVVVAACVEPGTVAIDGFVVGIVDTGTVVLKVVVIVDSGTAVTDAVVDLCVDSETMEDNVHAVAEDIEVDIRSATDVDDDKVVIVESGTVVLGIDVTVESRTVEVDIEINVVES